MNIYDLRKSVHVYSYNSHSDGCSIYYLCNHKVDSLLLNNIQLFQELQSIGSLADETDPEEYADYNLSQWDALNLVIRHELEKEVDKEIDNSDIGKAIDKLKNI